MLIAMLAVRRVLRRISVTPSVRRSTLIHVFRSFPFVSGRLSAVSA